MGRERKPWDALLRPAQDRRQARRTQAGQETVAVPLLVAAKLALYTAMREQGMTKVGLARLMGLSEGAIRKLVNPNHRSHIRQVEKALRKVGRRLVVEDGTV